MQPYLSKRDRSLVEEKVEYRYTRQADPLLSGCRRENADLPDFSCRNGSGNT